MHPSSPVFMSLKTSSLQILTGSLGFFLFFFHHVVVAKKHISGISRWMWCLYYLRTARCVYTAPCNAMQQLRSQKHSGSSAPHSNLPGFGSSLAGLPCSWRKVLTAGSSLCLLLHCMVQNDPGAF